MDWEGRIVATADTLSGRPRIAGTRIAVDFVLDLLAAGWSGARILDEYPHLKEDDLRAVFAFVRDCMKDEEFVLEARAAEGGSQRVDAVSRLHPIDGAAVAKLVLDALRAPVEQMLVVCTPAGIRRRPLPGASPAGA